MDHVATVRAFFDTWVDRDPEALADYFAPEGEWIESHRPAARGRAELVEVFSLQVLFATDFHFEMTMVAAVTNAQVVTERVDSWTLNGVRMAVDVMGIFAFDPDGKILRWRDYYDWADLERQLLNAGVDLTGEVPPTQV